MAANVQSGQQSFTVVKLPVVQIVLESLILPFRSLPELVKYGWIPFVGSLALRLMTWLVRDLSLPWLVLHVFVPIIYLALFCPLLVVWTRIAINGSVYELPLRSFAYERQELSYLAAMICELVIALSVVGVPTALYSYGQRSFDTGTAFVGWLLTIAGLLVALVGVVRFSLLFPAIAVGRYEGLIAAWRHSAGNLETLAVVTLLAYAPFEGISQVVRIGMENQPAGVGSVLAVVVRVIAGSLAAVCVTAAGALAYKTIVLDRGRFRQ